MPKRALSRNVVFELFDHELLVIDDRFDQVADRDDADQSIVFQDRKVADTLLGHDGHTLLGRPCQFGVENTRRHDLLYLGLTRRATAQDDIACIVTF